MLRLASTRISGCRTSTWSSGRSRGSTGRSVPWIWSLLIRGSALPTGLGRNARAWASFTGASLCGASSVAFSGALPVTLAVMPGRSTRSSHFLPRARRATLRILALYQPSKATCHGSPAVPARGSRHTLATDIPAAANTSCRRGNSPFGRYRTIGIACTLFGSDSSSSPGFRATWTSAAWAFLIAATVLGDTDSAGGSEDIDSSG